MSEASDIDLKFSGLASQLSLALGGAIATNLVLYGEFVFVALPDPKVQERGTTNSTSVTLVSTRGIGAGVAYYIMPANVYVSGSLMFTSLSIESSELVETNWGPGLGVKVGKEWWVSPNWGLGLYGGVDLARMRDQDEGRFDDPPVWTTRTFTLGFSATYN